MSDSTLVETARYEALHGSAIGCAGLVKNLADAVAALTAENERLTRDLATARENYDVMHASWKGLHWELDQLRAAPDQAEGPRKSRGDDVPSVTSRAEESVMDKGVFRYDTDKTRLGAPHADELARLRAREIL